MRTKPGRDYRAAIPACWSTTRKDETSGAAADTGRQEHLGLRAKFGLRPSKQQDFKKVK
jgi:hypothetical protein